MPGLLIPDDWDQQSDGYCVLSASVPNSPLWRANVRGAIHALTKSYNWDGQTGDDEQAAQVGKDIYQSVSLNCQPPIPVWVEHGTLVSVVNGVYTLTPEFDGTGWYVKVWLNHDGVDFVDAMRPQLTTDAQDYFPDPPTDDIYIYSRNGDVIYQGAHVTDYCHGVGPGAVDFYSTTQTFTALVTLGGPC